MKKRIKEKVQRIFLIINLIAMNMAFVVTAHAAENSTSSNKLMQMKPVQGFMDLLKDLQGVLLAVEAVLVVVLLIFNKIKEQAAEDDEKPKYKKQFKGVIVGGVVIVSLTAIVPVVLSYFV